MKNPLYALVIAKEWKNDVVSGKKRITIREGHRDYRNGPVLLGCNLFNWVVMADIVAVRHRVLGEVTSEEFKADGFKTRRELFDTLSKYYKNITWDSFVTVIRWDNVRGKLVDRYQSKKEEKMADSIQENQEDIHELARRMAEECPMVALADCPNHEQHNQDCYARGRADGFEAGIDWVKYMLDSGRFRTFQEFYNHHIEGQIAT